jgi:hypothetical protein
MVFRCTIAVNRDIAGCHRVDGRALLYLSNMMSSGDSFFAQSSTARLRDRRLGAIGCRRIGPFSGRTGIIGDGVERIWRSVL